MLQPTKRKNTWLLPHRNTKQANTSTTINKTHYLCTSQKTSPRHPAKSTQTKTHNQSTSSTPTSLIQFKQKILPKLNKNGFSLTSAEVGHLEEILRPFTRLKTVYRMSRHNEFKILKLLEKLKAHNQGKVLLLCKSDLKVLFGGVVTFYPDKYSKDFLFNLTNQKKYSLESFSSGGEGHSSNPSLQDFGTLRSLFENKNLTTNQDSSCLAIGRNKFVMSDDPFKTSCYSKGLEIGGARYFKITNVTVYRV